MPLSHLDGRSRIAAVLLVVVVVGGGGCAHKRPAKSEEQLLAMRERADQRVQQDSQALIQRLLTRAKTRYDQQVATRASTHPATTTQPTVTTIDILVISGGGDWGAFGAGFLKGWGRVPDGPMARPKFDVVTGVSTGALIAPFAFLGDDESIERVVHLYRNPKKDWVKQRWPLYFLPNNISFAEIPGLERELRKSADAATIHRIADEAATGRVLVMNTTNVDDGTMRVWDVGAEAQRAVANNDIDRIQKIMLASSGIPAAFPFRMIDGEMYVDGGVTGNIIYGGRVREDQSLPAQWKKNYPDLPMPKIRYWVIFNNQLRPLPQVTAPTWTAVVARSLEMGTRSATVTSMRHLHAMAEISRLKRGADMEVRIVAVPNDWHPPKPGVFVKEVMNNLADLGEKMGADPGSWRSDPPPP